VSQINYFDKTIAVEKRVEPLYLMIIEIFLLLVIKHWNTQGRSDLMMKAIN